MLVLRRKPPSLLCCLFLIQSAIAGSAIADKGDPGEYLPYLQRDMEGENARSLAQEEWLLVVEPGSGALVVPQAHIWRYSEFLSADFAIDSWANGQRYFASLRVSSHVLLPHPLKENMTSNWVESIAAYTQSRRASDSKSKYITRINLPEGEMEALFEDNPLVEGMPLGNAELYVSTTASETRIDGAKLILCVDHQRLKIWICQAFFHHADHHWGITFRPEHAPSSWTVEENPLEEELERAAAAIDSVWISEDKTLDLADKNSSYRFVMNEVIFAFPRGHGMHIERDVTMHGEMQALNFLVQIDDTDSQVSLRPKSNEPQTTPGWGHIKGVWLDKVNVHIEGASEHSLTCYDDLDLQIIEEDPTLAAQANDCILEFKLQPDFDVSVSFDLDLEDHAQEIHKSVIELIDGLIESE